MLDHAVKPVAEQKSNFIKVAAHSRSTAVAGAIAHIMRQTKQVEMQAIGPGAVNQATKAMAIARTYLVGDNIDIVCSLHFTEAIIEGQERTAIRFTIMHRAVD